MAESGGENARKKKGPMDRYATPVTETGGDAAPSQEHLVSTDVQVHGQPRSSDENADTTRSKRKSPTAKNPVKAKRRPPENPYIITECGREGGGHEESETESEDDPEANSVTSEEIPDSYSHAAANRYLSPELLEAYFPLAFAVSRWEPTKFNFDLRVLDTLRLPRALSRRGEDEPAEDEEVVFTDAAEAGSYLQERLDTWEVEEAVESSSSASARGAPLNKRQLFNDCTPLAELLRSGRQEMDGDLDGVRLDRYGNVAVWNAPCWSDASVQYAHGFPRRLIQQQHKGFLPGNIIACSRASNMCLRRMAVKDVASCVSRQLVEGVGLTLGKLLSCRFAALKYAGAEYLPMYLLRAMSEFGICFATFKALGGESLETLKSTLFQESHSEEETSQQSSTDDDGDSEEEPRVKAQSVLVQTEAVEREELSRWVWRSSKTVRLSSAARVPPPLETAASSTTGDPTGEGESARVTEKGRRASGTTSGRRKDKSSSRKPRKEAESMASAPEHGSESSTPSQQGGLVDVLLQSAFSSDLARVHFKERVSYSFLPSREDLTKAKDFLLRHRPLDLQEPAWAESVIAASDQALEALWQVVGENCTCVQEECEYKRNQSALMGARCRSKEGETSCYPCHFFTRLSRLSNGQGGDPPSKLRREMSKAFFKRLQLAEAASGLMDDVYRISGSGSELAQRVREGLMDLLDCHDTLLNSVRWVGRLQNILCPRLRGFTLTGPGYSNFWEIFRMVGRACAQQVAHQDGPRLALGYILLGIASLAKEETPNDESDQKLETWFGKVDPPADQAEGGQSFWVEFCGHDSWKECRVSLLPEAPAAEQES